MNNEDVSRRSIAVTLKASKLTARVLALALQEAGRKIQKAQRAHQTPQGKQSVEKLLGNCPDAKCLDLNGETKLFDRVARKWNVDYAFFQTGPDKYLLYFKPQQADALTGCFAEYSKRVLKRDKSRPAPIREQVKQAAEQVKQPPQRERERVKEAAREDR